MPHQRELCDFFADLSWTLLRWAEEGDDEPAINDEPPPDYGPPGSGAIITEYP